MLSHDWSRWPDHSLRSAGCIASPARRGRIWPLWHSFCDRCWNVNMTNEIQAEVMIKNLNAPGVKIKVWLTQLALYMSAMEWDQCTISKHWWLHYMYTSCYVHFLVVYIPLCHKISAEMARLSLHVLVMQYIQCCGGSGLVNETNPMMCISYIR